MRGENIKFIEFESQGVGLKSMSLCYESFFYRMYSYELGGCLFGVLIRADGITCEGWDELELEVKVIYLAECHCGSIENLWIGDDDGNLYCPEITDIYDSLKILEKLAMEHASK